jgi:hypothetical protein
MKFEINEWGSEAAGNITKSKLLLSRQMLYLRGGTAGYKAGRGWPLISRQAEAIEIAV